jgi:hypothetical protein
MAKRERDESRVPVIAGQPMHYDGRDYLPGAVIPMTPRDAADHKALHHVRDMRPGEVPQGYNRRDTRAR